MTAAVVPPDQPARDRIERAFTRNFLVEAGAGSGKTRSLARRMAAGVAGGAWRVEEMAAVTFTRKAAAELRGRFQEALEARLRTGDAAERGRVEAALQGIERLFAGTIHAFCAHLLRERPVEARIAPGFTDIDETEDARLRAEAWREFLVGMRAENWPPLVELREAGLRTANLDPAFAAVCAHEDVEFPAGDAPMPDTASAWRALDAFWRRLEPLVPAQVPRESKCDALLLAAGFGPRMRFASRRQRPADLASALTDWHKLKVTMKHWGAAGARARAEVEAFQQDTAAPFVEAWQRYVYRVALTVLREGRRFYAETRRYRNVVNYVDLLMVAARMLRENGEVRHALQRKYRWLFVDEFQDTDPIQAEIFLLLAANEQPPAIPPGPVDAWTVPLRPGALFVVGDPKQSIYRFRRADIEVYGRVRERIEACGGELARLTSNFRSVPGAVALANTACPGLFARHDARFSPAFEPLVPVRVARRGAGPGLHRLTVPAHVDKRDTPAWEAGRIARYIRREVERGRRFGDFLVLTRYRTRLAAYARAFDGLGIPVEVSGAGRFGGSDAVEALALLLRAVGDPLDAVSLVGVLRGPLFGVSDADLFRFKQAGGRFDGVAPVTGTDLDTIRAARDGHEAAAVAALDARYGPVLPAMRQMAALHALTRRLPLAAATERILERTGWLALGVTSPGGASAGDLLQAIDRVRQVVESGGDLLDASDALAVDEDQASEVDLMPLEPGRRDVVRLMNLHKAKGLEAAVVFLADPANARPFPIELRILREGERPIGYLKIATKGVWPRKGRTLAVADGWDAHETAEAAHKQAEEARLLYVAATRARDTLVVGSWASTTKDGRSKNEAWGAFDRALRDAPELPDAAEPTTPLLPGLTAGSLSREARARASAERERRAARARQATWEVHSVTGDHAPVLRASRVAGAGSAAGGDLTTPAPAGALDDPTLTLTESTPARRADAGAAWGTLVHGLLEHAMRARDRTVDAAESLRLARWLTVETPELRPHLEQAVSLVQAVSTADFWHEARAASECLVEVPFAVALDGAGDATGPAAEGAAPRPAAVVLRGVIDLAYSAADGWRILDYKTDADAGGAAERHAGQMAAYRRAWQQVVPGSPPDVRVVAVGQIAHRPDP